MFFIGLDLGQKVDFRAIAVVEKRAESRILYVRHLERMGLGTPYTEVVRRVSAMLWHRKLVGQARVVVDATGVGTPVVDLLRAEGVGGNVTAITITSGEKVTGGSERWGVPRKDLLGVVEVLIETGRLEIARKLKESERLLKELQAMRVNGRGGEHDDLVFALALACWRARFGEAGFRDKPLLDFGLAPEGYKRLGDVADERSFGKGWGIGR